MPSGVYKRTEWHRKRLEGIHRGVSTWNEGKKLGPLWAWNKGLFGEELKKHYPNGMKGLPKGNIPWNKDIPCTEETKTKISKTLTGKKQNISEETRQQRKQLMLDNNPMDNPVCRKKVADSKRGDKSHFWKGGKSFEEYTFAFNKALKEYIRERDNHVCQECGYTESQLSYILSVHHIDYDKKNNSKSNLVSLCKSCHSKTTFNRDDWTKHFVEKQETVTPAQEVKKHE